MTTRQRSSTHVPLYLSGIPRYVPRRWFVVHNHVRPVHPPGLNGFRVWLQPTDVDPPLEACDCGWASDRGYTHYRVVFDRS